MNIVYVVEDFSENGGVERIVSMKANLLVERLAHQVTLISVYRDDRPEKYVLNRHVTLLHLDVPFAKKSESRVELLWNRVATLCKAAKRLNETIADLHPDVIFFTTTLGALLLPLCRTKARKVYESHLARPFNPYHRLFGWMERKADLVVCLTQGDACEYRYAKKVCVIPNFINAPCRQVPDYSSKRVIAVGRLEHQKGFDILIDCWSKIATLYPDWQLDIYGEGSQHMVLQNQIERLHLERNVCLKGRCDHIMEVYPNYSLQVMTSRFEGHPMVLLEGQTCGLPAVVFDFQYGARDVIVDGENGLLVRQNDGKGFIEAACKLLSDTSMREHLGRNALLMSRRYSQERVFLQWKNLLGTRSWRGD